MDLKLQSQNHALVLVMLRRASLEEGLGQPSGRGDGSPAELY